MTVHLVKICVGAEKVEDLEIWQESRRTKQNINPTHVTRMWPKREAELIDGGSLYWVFKGFILARQQLIRLDERIGADGIRRCALVLSHDIVRTASAPRRPFQGWRYLSTEDAPPDLPKSRETEEALPQELQQALSDIGLF